MADPVTVMEQKINDYLENGKQPRFKMTELSAGFEVYATRANALKEKQDECVSDQKLIASLEDEIAADVLKIEELEARKAELNKEKETLTQKRKDEEKKQLKREKRSPKIQARIDKIDAQMKALHAQAKAWKTEVKAVKALKLERETSLAAAGQRLVEGNDFISRMATETTVMLETLRLIVQRYMSIPRSNIIKLMRKSDVICVQKIKLWTGRDVKGVIGASVSQLTANVIRDAAMVHEVTIKRTGIAARDAALAAVAQAAVKGDEPVDEED